MKKILFYAPKIGWALVVLILLFGIYRGFRWVFPATPDVYRVAIDSTWYPLSLYGREPAVTAFSIDVLFSIAKREKIQVDLIRSGPKRILELLEDGQVHGIMTGMKPDPQLEETYYFSDPYYRFGAVLVMRKEDSFTSLMSLPNKHLGVRRNSPVLYKVQIDPKATIIPFDSPVLAFEQLIRKEIDAVLIDQLLAFLYFGGTYQDKLKVVTLPLTIDGLRLVTLQDGVGEELIDSFNSGLKKIKDEGVYNNFLNQWDLYNPEAIGTTSP